MFGQRHIHRLDPALCFGDAGPCAAPLEKLINKSLILIPPTRPQLVSVTSSVGQQAKGFTDVQVSHKVGYNGDKGVPGLLSRTPSC